SWIESGGSHVSEIIVSEIISEDDILWPVGGGFNSKGMVDVFLLTIVANSEVTENIIHGITRIDVDQFFIVITKTYRRSYAQSVGVIPHLVGETDLAAVIGISTQPVAELAVLGLVTLVVISSQISGKSSVEVRVGSSSDQIFTGSSYRHH